MSGENEPPPPIPPNGGWLGGGGSTDEDGDDREPSEVVRDVFVILAAGVAILLGVVALTYLLTVVSDRFCCCFPWWRPVAPALELPPTTRARREGTVATKANLYGLEPTERRRILEYIFQKTAFIFSRNGDGDKNKTAPPTEKDATSSGAPPVVSPAASADKNEEKATTKDPEVGAKEHQDNDDDSEDKLDDADHERICCICLAEYEEGCRILTGTGCNHRVHYDCALTWLDKHDHCPYCRTEMITPQEMREAAVAVLDPERVQALGQPPQPQEPTASSTTTNRGNGTGDVVPSSGNEYAIGDEMRIIRGDIEMGAVSTSASTSGDTSNSPSVPSDSQAAS